MKIISVVLMTETGHIKDQYRTREVKSDQHEGLYDDLSYTIHDNGLLEIHYRIGGGMRTVLWNGLFLVKIYET